MFDYIHWYHLLPTGHTIGPPAPHHRSLPSSSGSISSMSSAEGSSQVVGTRGRPPTSLSVLSANSLAEVTKTIRERHSSIDGGLSPPPRVVSLEDARGFKVMTELVNHDPTDDLTPKNLSSKYTPLKPIVKSTSIQDWRSGIVLSIFCRISITHVTYAPPWDADEVIEQHIIKINIDSSWIKNISCSRSSSYDFLFQRCESLPPPVNRS